MPGYTTTPGGTLPWGTQVFSGVRQAPTIEAPAWPTPSSVVAAAPVAAPFIIPGSPTKNDNVSSLTKPGGAMRGDYYVVELYWEGNAATNPQVTGFTRAAFVNNVVGSQNQSNSYHYRAYDGTEGSSFACTGTDGWTGMVAYIVRGALGPPTILDASGAAGAATKTAPSQTPWVNNAMVAFSFWTWNGDSGLSLTSPAGFPGGLTPGGTEAIHYLYSQRQTTATATGSFTHTKNNSGTEAITFTAEWDSQVTANVVATRATTWTVTSAVTATTRATTWNVAATAPSSSTVYTDRFNRADTTKFSGGTAGSALGAQWDAPTYYVSGRAATRSADSGDFATFLHDLGTADHWAEVVVSAAVGVNAYAVVNARRTNSVSTPNGYLFFYSPSSGNWEIGKDVAGSYSAISTVSAGGTPPLGYKLRIEVEGTAIRGYVNDVLKLSTTDSSVTAGNYTGINATDSTTAGMIIKYDNFRCGALPYASDGVTRRGETATGMLINAPMTMNSPSFAPAAGSLLVHMPGAQVYNTTGSGQILAMAVSDNFGDTGGTAWVKSAGSNRGSIGGNQWGECADVWTRKVGTGAGSGAVTTRATWDGTTTITSDFNGAVLWAQTCEVDAAHYDSIGAVQGQAPLTGVTSYDVVLPTDPDDASFVFFNFTQDYSTAFQYTLPSGFYWLNDEFDSASGWQQIFVASYAIDSPQTVTMSGLVATNRCLGAAVEVKTPILNPQFKSHAPESESTATGVYTAGVALGDFLFICEHSDSGDTVTLAGWSAGPFIVANGRTSILWKFADAGDVAASATAANYTLSGRTGGWGEEQMYCYINVDATTPIDASITAALTGTLASLTASVPNTLDAVLLNSNSGGSGYTVSNMTVRYPAVGNNFTFLDKPVSAAGATGTETSNLTSQAEYLRFLLRPASGGGGGTTPVSASRIATWDVKATVVASRGTTWNTTAVVAATTRATTWTVRTPVTATTRATTWSALATITSSRPTTWNVLVPVAASSRSTLWVTRAVVTTSAATTWTVRTPVSTSRATTWAALAAVSASRATTWAAAQGVIASRSTTWNVAGSTTPVGASRGTTWAVSASVGASRASSWAVAARVAPSSRATTWAVLTAVTPTTRATTWTVRTPVAASSRATTWNINAVVTATRATTWATRTVVAAATRATAWATEQQVTASRATTWNVAGTLAFVGVTRSTTWNTAQAVSFTRATTWTVRTTVAPTSQATTWSVLTAVTPVSRATTWIVRQQIGVLRSTSWNVAAPLFFVSANRSTGWVTRAITDTQRSTSWNLTQAVIVTRLTAWSITVLVNAQRSTAWSIRQRVISQRGTTWYVAPSVATSNYLPLYPDTVLYIGTHRVHAIYQGAVKVWQAVE